MLNDSNFTDLKSARNINSNGQKFDFRSGSVMDNSLSSANRSSSIMNPNLMQRSQIIAQARKSEHQKKMQRGQTTTDIQNHHSADIIDDENEDLSGLDQQSMTSGMIAIGHQMPMTPQGGLSGMMQLNNRFAMDGDNTIEPSYID